MEAFDYTQTEAYKEEAKARWGQTAAYQEHTEKTKAYSKDQWQNAADGMDAIFVEFAACMQSGEGANSQAAQNLVKKLQQCISDNYYTCTPQILAGLGKMYTADPRFQNNIDKHGSGTAEFAGKAIGFFCQK